MYREHLLVAPVRISFLSVKELQDSAFVVLKHRDGVTAHCSMSHVLSSPLPSAADQTLVLFSLSIGNSGAIVSPKKKNYGAASRLIFVRAATDKCISVGNTVSRRMISVKI